MALSALLLEAKQSVAGISFHQSRSEWFFIHLSVLMADSTMKIKYIRNWFSKNLISFAIPRKNLQATDSVEVKDECSRLGCVDIHIQVR